MRTGDSTLLPPAPEAAERSHSPGTNILIGIFLASTDQSTKGQSLSNSQKLSSSVPWVPWGWQG